MTLIAKPNRRALRKLFYKNKGKILSLDRDIEPTDIIWSSYTRHKVDKRTGDHYIILYPLAFNCFKD